MTITDEQAERFAETFNRLVDAVGGAILGKDRVVRLALTCLLSDGHLLLEDVPGTGKTSLARAIANAVQGTTARIQFTPDLLPADVVGGVVYNQSTQRFDFKPGPVFASIVVADEINRASPKTQSALLEVMEEGRVTVDGTSHEVGRPFMVIATQNPVEHAGTYPLPEAQLDRFLMKTAIGYPDQGSLVALMSGATVRDRAALVQPVIADDAFARMASFATGVSVREEVLVYLSQIAEATREHKYVDLGLSTRGCMAYVRAAKTWAIAQGRAYVIPDDIRALRNPVLAHRLLLSDEAPYHDITADQVIDEVFELVPPPLFRGGPVSGGEQDFTRRLGDSLGPDEHTRRLGGVPGPDEHTRRRGEYAPAAQYPAAGPGPYPASVVEDVTRRREGESAAAVDEHTRRRESAAAVDEYTRRRENPYYGQGR